MQTKDATSRYATPNDWANRLSGPADLSSDRTDWSSALLRHWIGTSPDMDQPPLDHHYIVQHLGGAKKVERRCDGTPISTIVDCGSITIVTAGTGYQWRTQGPIEFAHLYISPGLLSRTALRCERAGEITLKDQVGCRDPLLEALFAAMIAEIRRPGAPEVLFLDCLLDAFLTKLVLGHSTGRVRNRKMREMLPIYQLRRVKDYIELRLADRLELADLARVAGGSVYHFSRAFRNSVGDTPYNYVLNRRTDRAKRMLSSRDETIVSTAAACGFTSTANFVKTFRRIVGMTPSRYRVRDL